MSQVDLAEFAEVPYVTVQRVMRCDSNPFLDHALRIARALEMPLDALFWLADGKPRSR